MDLEHRLSELQKEKESFITTAQAQLNALEGRIIEVQYLIEKNKDGQTNVS